FKGKNENNMLYKLRFLDFLSPNFNNATFREKGGIEMGEKNRDIKCYEIVSRDVSELKKNEKIQDDRLRKLEINDHLQNQQLQAFKDTVMRIENDTTWLRRTITKAIISGIVTIIITIGSSIITFIYSHY